MNCNKIMELGHTIEDSRKNYPELTDEILMKLRVWAEERGLKQVPDEMLALFAHSCYFDVENSKRCMDVYYRLRATVPEFFGNRDPQAEYLQQSLRALYVYISVNFIFLMCIIICLRYFFMLGVFHIKDKK